MVDVVPEYFVHCIFCRAYISIKTPATPENIVDYKGNKIDLETYLAYQLNAHRRHVHTNGERLRLEIYEALLARGESRSKARKGASLFSKLIVGKNDFPQTFFDWYREKENNSKPDYRKDLKYLKRGKKK